MDTSVSCREATKGDLPQVLGLYSQPDFDSGEVLQLSEAEDLFKRINSYPDYTIYVAVFEDQIVGTFALLVMDNLGHKGARSAIIEDVAVAPSFQRRGVGKQMMAYALQSAGKKGCYKAMLSSNVSREKAHEFYESLGFARHGYSYRTSTQQGA
ncbi:MAG: GNAT family N-acetyltransferase [Proteobacteria bacterium]|nr:GNAT family N-acetyltransferase [Pseudomonadota bacterium]